MKLSKNTGFSNNPAGDNCTVSFAGKGSCGKPREETLSNGPVLLSPHSLEVLQLHEAF